MQAQVYNQQGEATGSFELDAGLFAVTPRPAVLARAVEAQQSRSRQVLAHTKTRSEVRGGGRKPWRQKGTGRARHGSIRSPIWKGGGVTFGPRSNRNFEKGLNKKEARKALCMALTQKAMDGKVVLLDDLSLDAIKTKNFAQLLGRLPVKERSTLVVQPSPNLTVAKSARNIPRISTILADSLNVVDVLKHEYLLMPTASIATMKKTFLKA